MLDGAPTFADLPHVRWVTIREFEAIRLRRIIAEMTGGFEKFEARLQNRNKNSRPFAEFADTK